MLSRVRRFFDVRSGEGLPVLLAFLYVAFVVAALLLAKPLRNSLFLDHAAPMPSRMSMRPFPSCSGSSSRSMPGWSRGSGLESLSPARWCSSASTSWRSGHTFSFKSSHWLPAAFYVWVNCFGVIAPVQAWSFANSVFDLRQARRLFGLIGAGASLGSIAEAFSRLLVDPVGGTVNMLLVLAALILASAVIVVVSGRKLKARGLTKPRTKARSAQTFGQTFQHIISSPYLRLLGALVFMTAIVTQWANFQLSVVAADLFAGDKDKMTEFFGTFNFVVGASGFLLQLFVTTPLLRRFGCPPWC